MRKNNKRDHNFSVPVKSKIKNRALEIGFDLLITYENIDLVKKVLKGGEFRAQDEDLEEIEVGDEISMTYGIEADYSDNILFLTILFNSSLAGSPKMRLIRK